MSNRNKEKRSRRFRLAVIDDKTHKQLVTIHFTKTSLMIAVITVFIVFSAAFFSIIAFTPARTFIPGYPDARSKRAAIQNAITIDSLERVIYRWEFYAENLRRVVEGRETLKIDSLINLSQDAAGKSADISRFSRQDSLLREHVKKEEQFGISDRDMKDLPIEGLHFFTPLKGVVS
ncbi:MAG: hypothetical protein IJ005_02570, partial [Bacteroidales bacterium]|nr:hypothetical protein [Bacteroidales bacterium]